MKVEEQIKQTEKKVEEVKPDYGNNRIEIKFTAERQRTSGNREIETEKKEEVELNKNDQSKESVLNNPVNPREAPGETPTELPSEVPPSEMPEISPVELPDIDPKEIPEKGGEEQGSGMRY